MARQTRQTSIDAYDTIKANGLLSAARFKIYEILYKFGDLTRSEIDSKLSFGCYKSHVSARLCEMREMGIVEEIGTRDCSVSGHNVIVWRRIPENIPVKVKKLKKTKCQHCNGKGYI